MNLDLDELLEDPVGYALKFVMWAILCVVAGVVLGLAVVYMWTVWCLFS